MQLTKLEFSAIVKFSKQMSIIDGNVDFSELEIIKREFIRFNIPTNEIEWILERGDSMDFEEAVSYIKNLNSEQKEYVTSLLGEIITADGVIDDKEKVFWSIISLACDLPTMTIAEALINMNTKDY